MTTPAALRLLAPTAALLLALTACGDESGDDGNADDPGGGSSTDSQPSDPGGDPTGEATSYDHPTGASDIVLDVTTAGGFTSAEYQFSLQPELRVYGDGTVIVQGDVPPESSFVPQLTGTLDEAGLQQLFALADDAGLLGPDPGYDMTGSVVTDQPSTNVLVQTDEQYSHNAYALDFTDSGDTPERERLRDFVAEATDLASQTVTEPYQPDSLKLLVEVDSAPSADSDVVDWPESGPALADGVGCRVFDGAGVAAVSRALEEAAPGSVFRDGTSTYTVNGAAVLPGDGRPCDPA